MTLYEELDRGQSAAGFESESFSITQLAREFQVTTRAIRFYEDKGLVHPTRKGTTRIYDNRDRVHLELVLRGKRLGFSLGEVAEIIAMYGAGPGEKGQLEYMLRRLAERRNSLIQQRKDLDQTLKELDQIETKCRFELSNINDSTRSRST